MFRSLGKSKIGIVLAILFGVSLLFFKTGSRYSNLFNSDSVVAKVSNTPISTTKFNRTMQMNINKFNQLLGKEITGDEIRAFQIHSLALNALINDAVFEDEFNQINFKLDEKIVALKTKERIPKLYDSNNKLNNQYLTTFLKQQQLKIEDIVQIIDYETRNDYFNDAFFELKYPEYFSNQIEIYNKHKRNISYVELNINQIEINEIIKEKSTNLKNELIEYYEENINNYQTDEKREVEFFSIDRESLSFDFIPTELDIREYYNSNKDLFFENEKRSFIQFNFESNEQAINFKNEIKKLDMEDILPYAKNNNIFFKTFENLQSNEILKKIADPLFKLAINQISDVIETSISKHILINQSIQKSNQLMLDQVKDEIKLTIKEIDTDNYYNNLLDEISEKVINGDSINNIADNFSLKIRTIKDLTKNYDNFNKKDELLFKNLIQSSFLSNKDFVSDIININKNLSYVFNVSKIDLSESIKYEEINELILDDWSNSQKIKKIKLDIKENKNDQMYIAQLAKKYNSSVKEISISNNSEIFPSNILNVIFKSKKNDNIESIYGDKIFIIRTNDIIFSDNISNLEKVLMNSDLRTSFGKELMKNKKISTNDNLINAIIDQF